MATVYLFCLILLSHLVLLLSARYGNGYQDNCPRSFNCGKLGTFHYPFTKAGYEDCGLLVIHNCDKDDDVLKIIQLEKNGKKVILTSFVQQDKIISISDDDFFKRLQNKTCDTLNHNFTLPSPSPLVSIYIQYNVTLFRCNHKTNVIPPPQYYKYPCPDYDIYYDSGLVFGNKDEARTTFSACSVLKFPTKDSTDTKDILSFVSSQVVLVVQLSDECDHCFNHKKGQCRLDTNNNFICNEAAEQKGYGLKLRIGLGVGLAIALLGILIIGCLFRRHYKRKRAPSDPQYQSRNTDINVIDPHPNPDAESGRAYFGLPLFSYKELKEATNNFHHSSELGNGGFGTVYYGKLRDGREVAVKRLYENNYRRVEQFTNEIEILTRMRHKNLVSLYGCTSRHCRELLLVYEYIPNGTVASHLHGDLARPSLLPWHIRMKIAIETATSLAFLHASDIIHRDVKTNNILLDNNFWVKVADFGLSRLFPNDVTHVSTAPQGTPGYVDPEYYQCYQLTSKSDVYSFGVVLIELISSKPAVDMNRQKDEINLSNLAIKKIQESAFGELVDPSLGFDSDNEVKRMIVSMAELAFQCLQREKELRPSMDEVLKGLRRIESGQDEPEHLEEDVHGAGVSFNNVHPPPLNSPDRDEVGLLKNTKLRPSSYPVADQLEFKFTTHSVVG